MQGERLESVLQEQSIEVDIAHAEPEHARRPLNRNAASEDVLLEVAAYGLDNRLLRRLPTANSGPLLVSLAPSSRSTRTTGV